MTGIVAKLPEMLLGAALLALSSPAIAETPHSSNSEPRVVNITAGSQTVWVPSSELEHDALSVATSFFAMVDQGDDAGAYRTMSPVLKSELSADRYASDNRAFRDEAGLLHERKFNFVTWTKDSPNAPLAGTYVAIDIVAKYQNIDRFCGYLILHQPDATSPFQVTRAEGNYMTNASIVAVGSDQARSLWKQLSGNCPNYRPLELEEEEASTIGYASVAAALADLRSRPEVIFEEQRGWTIATDEKAFTIWSFSPPDYPAYPAVVKRQAIAAGAVTHMDMNVHCEASKEACDELVRTFAEMNGMPLQ